MEDIWDGLLRKRDLPSLELVLDSMVVRLWFSLIATLTLTYFRSLSSLSSMTLKLLNSSSSIRLDRKLLLCNETLALPLLFYFESRLLSKTLFLVFNMAFLFANLERFPL